MKRMEENVPLDWKLEEICAEAEAIGISGHIRPDGDCVGATLALYLYLKKRYPQKRIKVFLESVSPDFRNLNGIEGICTDVAKNEPPFDLFFAVDCEKSRLGKAERLYDTAKRTANIDHHISNACASDYNYILPNASSASELVYDLLDDTYIDRDIAQAIYLGIVHDTGVFQYSNTSPKTLRVAAKLISYGFDFSRLIAETFYEKTYAQNRMLGEALLTSRLYLNGLCIGTIVSRAQMEKFGLRSGELDGIVSTLRDTKGVDCAVFMYELPTGEWKASLRSGGIVNVAAIGEKHGGGGHMRAAGCNLRGDPAQCMQTLVQEVNEALLAAGYDTGETSAGDGQNVWPEPIASLRDSTDEVVSSRDSTSEVVSSREGADSVC